MKIRTHLNTSFGLALAAALFLSSCGNQATQQKEITLSSRADTISYIHGLNWADVLQQRGIEIDPDILLAGLNHKLDSGELLIEFEKSREMIQAYYAELQQKQRQEQEARQREQFAPAIEEANKFFGDNAQKDGVTTTQSGLQYEVITAGNGPKPGPTDRVLTHYHGTLLNGTVFDSSVDRGEPIAFGVNQVISGWTEALQLMPEGSKWKLYIPQQLAYGARGQGSIPPYSALVFEVELIKINP